MSVFKNNVAESIYFFGSVILFFFIRFFKQHKSHKCFLVNRFLVVVKLDHVLCYMRNLPALVQ